MASSVVLAQGGKKSQHPMMTKKTSESGKVPGGPLNLDLVFILTFIYSHLI